jgi:hypothetical protein
MNINATLTSESATLLNAMAKINGPFPAGSLTLIGARRIPPPFWRLWLGAMGLVRQVHTVEFTFVFEPSKETDETP